MRFLHREAYKENTVRNIEDNMEHRIKNTGLIKIHATLMRDPSDKLSL